MKLTYVFPVTGLKTDVKAFFNEFSKTKFFKKYQEDYELFFVADSENKEVISSAKAMIKTNKNIKLLELEKAFNYGEAFKFCLSYIKGDITLLGDVEYDDNATVFEDMMQKHKEGADVVHVKEKKYGFKAFVDKALGSVYNMFTKLFTSKEDDRGLLSLGLVDKLVTDVLTEIPEKTNFLRNCKTLEGIEVASVEIEPTQKKYKPEYFINTPSLISSIVMFAVFVLSIGAIVAINVVKAKEIVFLNIILIFVLFVSLLSIFILLNKHILDIRSDNYSNNNAIVGKFNIK